MRFSSLERLKFYDISQTSPIESISCVFNILLQLPNDERPQPYKITVRIQSSIAMQKKFEKEQFRIPSVFRLFRGAIFVEVEYVDYVVARNIISTIDSWVREIEIPKKVAIRRFLHQKSHWIPRIATAAIFIISSVAALAGTSYISRDVNNNLLLARFLITSFSFVVAAGWLAHWVGRFAESAIDSISETSCIVINRGDERLLKNAERANIASAFRACFWVSWVIIQGVFTKVLVSLIYTHML
jgi:hypothetical protein